MEDKNSPRIIGFRHVSWSGDKAVMAHRYLVPFDLVSGCDLAGVTHCSIETAVDSLPVVTIKMVVPELIIVNDAR